MVLFVLTAVASGKGCTMSLVSGSRVPSPSGPCVHCRFLLHVWRSASISRRAGGWWWSQLPAACRVLPSLLKGVLMKSCGWRVGLSASLSPWLRLPPVGGLAGGRPGFSPRVTPPLYAGFQGCLCYWGLVVLLRCLVVCAWRCAFRVCGAPGLLQGVTHPKLPAHFFQSCLCPTPLGGSGSLCSRIVPPLTEALLLCLGGFSLWTSLWLWALCPRRRPLLHGGCSVSALLAPLSSPPRPP